MRDFNYQAEWERARADMYEDQANTLNTGKWHPFQRSRAASLRLAARDARARAHRLDVEGMKAVLREIKAAGAPGGVFSASEDPGDPRP